MDRNNNFGEKVTLSRRVHKSQEVVIYNAKDNTALISKKYLTTPLIKHVSVPILSSVGTLQLGFSSHPGAESFSVRAPVLPNSKATVQFFLS